MCANVSLSIHEENHRFIQQISSASHENFYGVVGIVLVFSNINY